jgi:hypothetical protein
VGEYGSSKIAVVAAWAYSAWLLQFEARTDWARPRAWIVADVLLLALFVTLAWSLTFRPALVIDRDLIKRRWRSAIAWHEVVAVLPPSRLGRGMRIRLNDRAVIELPQVSAERAEAMIVLSGTSPSD